MFDLIEFLALQFDMVNEIYSMVSSHEELLFNASNRKVDWVEETSLILTASGVPSVKGSSSFVDSCVSHKSNLSHFDSKDVSNAPSIEYPLHLSYSSECVATLNGNRCEHQAPTNKDHFPEAIPTLTVVWNKLSVPNDTADQYPFDGHTHMFLITLVDLVLHHRLR